MKVLFVAGFGPVLRDPAAGTALYIDTLGLPLEGDDGYFHTLLRDGTTYRDRGPNDFDQRDRQQVERRLGHRLQDLGYRVTLEPVAAD